VRDSGLGCDPAHKLGGWEISNRRTSRSACGQPEGEEGQLRLGAVLHQQQLARAGCCWCSTARMRWLSNIRFHKKHLGTRKQQCA